MNAARYIIVEDRYDYLCIQDVGPWDKCRTVTNAAEAVVAELLSTLAGRRLEYIDSNGERGVLEIKDGEFVGFAHSAKGGAS